MTVSSFAKLAHAYGPAKDIPRLLRDLGSARAKERSQAIFQLGASICHQGTFYSATPATIPHLVALLGDGKVKDKQAILALLADIATLDDHGHFLLTGLETKALPRMPKLWTKSLDAVRAGGPVYQALLSAPEPAVRARAAFLLAWLDTLARETTPRVVVALERETNPETHAALLLSLGYLGRYRRNKDAAAIATKALAHDKPVVRGAAALALVLLGSGKVDADVLRLLAETAVQKKLAKTTSPWLGGDLAFFATRALIALPAKSSAVFDALIAVVEAGTPGASTAAVALVARTFPKARNGSVSAAAAAAAAAAATKKPAAKKERSEFARRDRRTDRELAAVSMKLEALDPPGRRLLDALDASATAWDHEVMTLLADRGLPSTAELLRRVLTNERSAKPSILDRVLADGGATIADRVAAAAKASGEGRATHVSELVSGLAPEDLVAAMLTAIVDLDGAGVPDVALELAWASGPKAEAPLRAALDRLERDGVPKRVSVESTMEFPMCMVAAAVGLASAAIAKKAPGAPRLDHHLQRAYGFWPRVRDALAALPLARREKWVLDPGRDNRAQPSEHFLGAWPYWTTAPTKKVTARVLAHVATWKPKDPWGGARARYADPHLVAYIEALRAAGEDASACEAALDGLASKPVRPNRPQLKV
jgi:hypothetical protein